MNRCPICGQGLWRSYDGALTKGLLLSASWWSCPSRPPESQASWVPMASLSSDSRKGSLYVPRGFHGRSGRSVWRTLLKRLATEERSAACPLFTSSSSKSHVSLVKAAGRPGSPLEPLRSPGVTWCGSLGLAVFLLETDGSCCLYLVIMHWWVVFLVNLTLVDVGRCSALEFRIRELCIE